MNAQTESKGAARVLDDETAGRVMAVLDELLEQDGQNADYRADFTAEAYLRLTGRES